MPVAVPSRRGRRGAVWIPRAIPLQAGDRIQYHVYGNTGAGGPINYAAPLAVVDGLAWTSSSLAAPGTWKLGVRAFDAVGGLEEQNLDCAVTIVLDSHGSDITNQPRPPIGLRALAAPGGGITVEWYYPMTQGPQAPTGFHVYSGTGGSPSYSTPAAAVLYSTGFLNTFQAALAGLVGGTTYAIGVRAYNGSGEESNTTVVSVTAAASGPAAVTGLAAQAIV